jgi:hypothetical protein
LPNRDRRPLCHLDGAEAATGNGDLTGQNLGTPPNSTYAVFYFPWLQVFDPVTKSVYPNGDGGTYVPPSGHIAGIYARVDAERGVHKAPPEFSGFSVTKVRNKDNLYDVVFDPHFPTMPAASTRKFLATLRVTREKEAVLRETAPTCSAEI